MMISTTAIILAGGLGTRLQQVVSDLPKPMAPIEGRPFLEYLLDYWLTQGITHFILAIGYRHEIIVKHFKDGYKGAKIEFVIEPQPLGTGGGLLLASEKINPKEAFLLLNGDTYFRVDLFKLRQFFQKNDADWAFSLFESSEMDRYMGMEILPEGQITSLQSCKPSMNSLVNGGVYMVRPQALSAINFVPNQKISLENDIFPSALTSGQRLFGLKCAGSFIDIGIPADYFKSHTIVGKN